MSTYSFLKENHGFSINQPTVDEEGNPNGEVSVSHSESDNGDQSITKMTSHRQWTRKLDSNSMEPFFSMFHGLQDGLRDCDGFGEEDMFIRCKAIPQIQYQFKKYCHDSELSPETTDLYRYTSDHIIRDLEDELAKESECDTNNLMKILDCSYVTGC